MIGFVRGTVAGRTADACLIEVSGVGYGITCSAATLSALPPRGGTVKLWTHLQVRDDALVLYGFATESEQQAFESLITVSGVGPKGALQVCSSLPPDSLRKALVTDDLDLLASVPGIGKKTARRILLELKERFSLPDLEVVGARPDAAAKARSALENLGYTAAEARAALAEVPTASDDGVEELVKSALKVLG